jgi:prepilin-type N-terminal cleavage/methylation domain-containing protein/prepilin-type processing-associated H-X9-DG protein
MRAERAYSLIELLVVIAIIGILAAILIPSLSIAKQRAHVARCLANVRELSTAYRMYTQDTDAKGVVYNQGTALWIPMLQPYGNIDKIRMCPEAVYPSFTSDWGTATECWHGERMDWLVGYQGSYGLNGWLYWWGKAEQDKLQTHTGDDPSEMITMPTTLNESRIPVFGDCNWVDGWPRADEEVPASLTTGSLSPNKDYMGRFCLDRHNKTVNIAFLDGHAENLRLPALWTLQWSAHFTPNYNPSRPPLP